MAFLTPLVLEDVPGGWIVAAPFVYEHDGEVYTVPTGTFTDLASIPRLFWIVYPRDGGYRKAAVVHDWLVAAPAKMSWAQAADIFEAAMADAGVPRLRRKVLANAVRLWGRFR